MNKPQPVDAEDAFPEMAPDREFPFTRADFAELAKILHGELGIILEPGKMSLVYSRLVKRLRILNFKSFKQYCGHVSTYVGAGERRLMLEALTTNVTRFFREAHHFEHLRTQVLPELLGLARQGARIRLWSAGCSSGEEPYSIALTTLSLMPDAGRYDIKILATDIDRQVLEEGSLGVYPSTAVAKVSKDLRERWMQPVTLDDGVHGWKVGEDLRRLVTFRTANLVGDWPMKGPFQVIFCRNVVIYFDEMLRAQVLHKLADLLAPGGHLYIGHSERMGHDAADMEFVALSTYRRLGDPI